MSNELITIGNDKITHEELDYIVSGVRPENMNYEVFKRLRKEVNRGIKTYLKGRYFFVSTTVRPKEGSKEEFVRHSATYVNEK